MADQDGLRRHPEGSRWRQQNLWVWDCQAIEFPENSMASLRGSHVRSRRIQDACSKAPKICRRHATQIVIELVVLVNDVVVVTEVGVE